MMFDFKLKQEDFSFLEIETEDFLTPRFLEETGNAFLFYIIKAAKEDLAKQGNKKTDKGKPEGIPDDSKFFESFGFDIKPDKTIEIYSTWPWIEQIMEGRRAFPMKWLTKPSVSKVSFSKKTPLIRSAPGARDPWIHPGFKKHNFIQRGVEQAFIRIQANFANQVRKTLEG